MADVKTGYATGGQALTISLASLGDAAGRESTAVNNNSGSTERFLDILISARVKPQNSGSITDPKVVYVYAYGSVDGGSEYTDGVTGTDAAFTVTSPNNLKLLGVIYVAAINVTYRGGPWGLASVFGGRVPERWGVVVYNDCGTALSATGGDHAVEWQGIYGLVS